MRRALLALAIAAAPTAAAAQGQLLERNGGVVVIPPAATSGGNATGTGPAASIDIGSNRNASGSMNACHSYEQPGCRPTEPVPKLSRGRP